MPSAEGSKAFARGRKTHSRFETDFSNKKHSFRCAVLEDPSNTPVSSCQKDIAIGHPIALLKTIEPSTYSSWAEQAFSTRGERCRYTIKSRPSTPTVQDSPGNVSAVMGHPAFITSVDKLNGIMRPGCGYAAAEKLQKSPVVSCESIEPYRTNLVRKMRSSQSERTQYPPTSWRGCYSTDARAKETDERYFCSASPPHRPDMLPRRSLNYFDPPEDNSVEQECVTPSERGSAVLYLNSREMLTSSGSAKESRLMESVSFSQSSQWKTESVSDFSLSSQDGPETPSSPVGTYSLSTISAAPTPFSSPLTSPLFEQNGSQQETKVLLSVTAQRNIDSSTPNELRSLPSPDTAYSRVSYYTQCPHSSPPFPRPLDVQPMTIPLPEGLTEIQNSFEHILDTLIVIEEEQMSMPETVSVILGACPNCDLMYRRQKESVIISRYNYYIDELKSQDHLYEAHHQEIFDHEDVDTTSLYNGSANMSPQPVNPTRVMGRLLEERDSEVKRVWQGLTQRWGPGLVGIQRQVPESNASFPLIRSNIDDFAREDTHSCVNLESMNKKFHGATISDPTCRPSRASSTSTGRAINIRGNNNVDGVIDDGRMRIDWIRPDRYV